MDAFYRLTTGGSSIEQFARDVYTKDHLTRELMTVISVLKKESVRLNQLRTAHVEKCSNHGGIRSYSSASLASGQSSPNTSSTSNPAASDQLASDQLASNIGAKSSPRPFLQNLIIPLSDTSSSSVSHLCSLLEAVFLHGLKEKLSLNKITASLLTSAREGSSRRSPEIDFWCIIQILSHHQVSESVNCLRDIHTDTGRCRSWLRVTLNESLVGSYLESLMNDTTLLSGFYKSSAYLRDGDHISRLRRDILQDLDSLPFQLNYDDPTLNSWTDHTLKILGLPVLTLHPVIPALDALGEEMNRGKGVDGKSVIKRNMIKKSGRESAKVQRDQSAHVRSDQSAHVQKDQTAHVQKDQSIEVQSVSSSTANIEVSASNSAVCQVSAEGNSQLSAEGNSQPSGVDFQDTVCEGDSPESTGIVGGRGRTPSMRIQPAGPMQESSHHSVKYKPAIRSSQRSRMVGNSLGNKQGWSSSRSRMVGNSLGNKQGWSSSSTLDSDFVPAQYGSIVTDYISSCEVALSSTPDIRDVVNSSTMSLSPPGDATRTYAKGNNVSPSEDPFNTHAQSRSRQMIQKIQAIIDPPKRFSSIDAKEAHERKREEDRVCYVVESKFGDYEVIPKSLVLNNDDPEIRKFLSSLIKICPQVGLDEQDYKCKSCGRPIGLIYGNACVDKFDGFNYCSSGDCFDSNLESVVPSRILFNFDFKKHPISKSNYQLINLIMTEPLFDIKILSLNVDLGGGDLKGGNFGDANLASQENQTPNRTPSLLYQMNQEMREMLDMRTQLFYLHGYIFTCAEATSLELRKLVWPKEHLFEHVHLYSLDDLINIKTGQLKILIKRAISYGRKHVGTCALCSQKGFICELCKSPSVIYPFDTDTTLRCESCHSVYHKGCCLGGGTSIAKKIKLPEDCPRCKRIEKRKKMMQENF